MNFRTIKMEGITFLASENAYGPTLWVFDNRDDAVKEAKKIQEEGFETRVLPP